MKNTCLLLLISLATACTSKQSDYTSRSGPGPESPASAEEVKNILGFYAATDNELTLNGDLTYSMTNSQEIAFDTSTSSEPASRLFPVCGTDETGKFELFNQDGKHFIRFSPGRVILNVAASSHHGVEQNYDSMRVCSAFAIAKKQPYVQEYRVAGKGAIALLDWKIETKYFGLLAHISSVYEDQKPFPDMMFMSTYQVEVDVTDFIAPYLASAYAPDHVKENGRFAPREIAFDLATKKFSYINNQCGFAIDFLNTKIVALNDEFRINETSRVAKRLLTSVSSAYFKLHETKEQADHCTEIEAKMQATNFVKRGFYFHVTDPTTADVVFGDEKVELYIKAP
jgi:hypothetical protein